MDDILQQYTTSELRYICNQHNKDLKDELKNSSFSKKIKDKIKEIRFIDVKLKKKNEIIERMLKLQDFFTYLSSESCCNNNVISAIPEILIGE